MCILVQFYIYRKYIEMYCLKCRRNELIDFLTFKKYIALSVIFFYQEYGRAFFVNKLCLSILLYRVISKDFFLQYEI